MRIVSLLPSATEIVCALGGEEDLVGVSHDCDWPPAVAQKPTLSSSDIPLDADQSTIDREVRENRHEGKSIYHVNEERLQDLQPDLVLTQELCEVCAPDFDEVQDACRYLEGSPRILSLEPDSLEEILGTIQTVGEAMDRQKQAEELVRRLRGRIEEIDKGVPDEARRPRVLSLEWFDPLFAGGHWVPEMIERSGGQPFLKPGEHSHTLDREELLEWDPEYLVLMPCGYTLQQTLSRVKELDSADLPKFLTCVGEGRVYAVNGSYYFNRPGPRIVTGLETLARIFHPDLFSDLDLPDDALRKLAPNRVVASRTTPES